eukprot:COSAG02_NODE_18603_length_929_cov_264.149398_2_plen_81_part_01
MHDAEGGAAAAQRFLGLYLSGEFFLMQAVYPFAFTRALFLSVPVSCSLSHALCLSLSVSCSLSLAVCLSVFLSFCLSVFLS